MSLKELLQGTKRTDLLITPKLTLWLMQNSHVVVPPEVAEKLSAAMQAKPRDRSASFSASARGNCVRAQVLQYLGYPQKVFTDTALSRIFIDGTWRHLKFQAMLMTAGIITDFEHSRHSSELRLTGSLDGVNVPEAWGFELKGINMWGFNTHKKKNKMMYKHWLQVGSYFVLFPELERFSVIYEDKNTNQLVEWVVHKDDGARDEALQEIRLLNHAVDTKRVPLGELRGSCTKNLNGRCPYRDVCLGATWIDLPELESVLHIARRVANRRGRIRHATNS